MPVWFICSTVLVMVALFNGAWATRSASRTNVYCIKDWRIVLQCMIKTEMKNNERLF